MRKYGALLLVVVLAITGLAAAAAYNTATVESSMTLKVVSTEQALLALVPHDGVGNKDNTARVDDENGTLSIELGRSGLTHSGRSPQPATGLQPNSEYVWDDMFDVVNNSNETIKVDIAVDSEDHEFGQYLKVEGTKNHGNDDENNDDNHGHGPTLSSETFTIYDRGDQRDHTITLAPGESASVAFTVDMLGHDDVGLHTHGGTLTVSAEAISDEGGHH